MIGGLEGIRRIIPRSIMQSHNKGSSSDLTSPDTRHRLHHHKLVKLNAFGHIFYEVSGTIGAFFSTYMILKFGSIFALLHLPPCFFVASAIILLIDDKISSSKDDSQQKQ